MGVVWETQWGRRRVAECPPDVVEALTAASGLTDNLDEQIELAASLIGLPVEEVRAVAVTLVPPRKPERTVSVTGRNGASKIVVVERTTRRKINRV
jgi:hypothetical protein